MENFSIINTQIVLPNEIVYGKLIINKGKIASIVPGDSSSEEGEMTIDGKAMYVLPGMIDSHVHIRGGVFSHREDFQSGTAAAAAGGVTTVFEMPLCNPPASTEEVFLKRQEEIAGNSYVDYCLYGGAGIDNLAEIPKIAKAGAVGFKTFLMPPVKFREDEFYGLCSETKQDLINVMEVVADTKLPIAIHAELNEYIYEIEKRLKSEGQDGLMAFCQSRPKIAEIEAVRRVISCLERTSCKALVCHISTFEAMRLVSNAQKKGISIYGETCPQYLLFSDESAGRAGVFARIKPPFRDQSNVDKLMELYRNGYFDATGSDHAPYLYDEKVKNGDSIWSSLDGIPGIELSLPLLLNKVKENKITLVELSNALSAKPAKLFNIAGDKGSIEIGKDADLVLIEELDTPKKIKLDSLFTKSKQSALLYESIPLYFDIKKTFVRGKEVFSDGAVVGGRGSGKWIKPQI
ncbi:amidohydrolase family protein [Bacillota bacterium]